MGVESIILGTGEITKTAALLPSDGFWEGGMPPFMVHGSWLIDGNVTKGVVNPDLVSNSTAEGWR